MSLIDTYIKQITELLGKTEDMDLLDLILRILQKS